MNSYIKGVAVFKDSNENGRRTLALERGLNIITGHSKTGKSAILDIIDWCLGSKDSTIPRGVITDFANYYALLIKFQSVTLLLARKNGTKGKNYLHVKQVSSDLSINDVKLEEIDKDYFFKRKIALDKINEFVDLSLGDDRLIDVNYKIPNVTLRSALSFNFQHQDIISSNSRLFYIYPKMNHFPILAGWFDSNYYIVLENIDKYKKEINRLSKINENAKKDNISLEQNLKHSLQTYYTLIGKEFNENLNIEQYINKVEDLEDFKREEHSNKLIERQERLSEEIDKKEVEGIRLRRLISKLETQKREGKGFKGLVERYQERASSLQVQENYCCPICDKPNEQLSMEALSVIEADVKLKAELETIPSYTVQFDIEIDELNILRAALRKEINILKEEQKRNQAILGEIDKEGSLNKQKELAKWKVISENQIYSDRKVKVEEQKLDELEGTLVKLQERKRTYNETELYEEAEKEIRDKMSLIVELLDFEHKPPELFFELNPVKSEPYKLYHNDPGEERVFLRQIGSASNALACHIGLFLSFLNYFSKQGNSKVPSFLFFDQPSQVYFPSGKDNKDIEKVAQIYETILDEIQKIEEEAGFAPQIIIADHIKDLGEETVKLYGHYFKADWRDGKGFI